MGGSGSSWLLILSEPDLVGDLEPRVSPPCLSFLFCTMGFGLVEEFPKVTDSSSLRTGSVLLEFGDFCIQKPFALTPACTLPPLPQFPWAVSSEAWDPALSFWVLTGAWLPPLPSPGDSSPLAAEWQRQHEGSGKWGKGKLT